MLDKTVEEDMVVLRRIGDKEGKGDGVECVLWEVEGSSTILTGMEEGRWEEMIDARGKYTPERQPL